MPTLPSVADELDQMVVIDPGNMVYDSQTDTLVMDGYEKANFLSQVIPQVRMIVFIVIFLLKVTPIFQSKSSM